MQNSRLLELALKDWKQRRPGSNKNSKNSGTRLQDKPGHPESSYPYDNSRKPQRRQGNPSER